MKDRENNRKMKSYMKPRITPIKEADCLLINHSNLLYHDVPQIFNETLTLAYDDTTFDLCILQGPLQFQFDVSGLTPNGPGTLTVSATGDINDLGEFYTVFFEGDTLSPTVGETSAPSDCSADIASETFSLSLSQLVSASSDDTVTVTAQPSNDVNCSCDGQPGLNRVTVTLNFLGTVES